MTNMEGKNHSTWFNQLSTNTKFGVFPSCVRARVEIQKGCRGRPSRRPMICAVCDVGVVGAPHADQLAPDGGGRADVTLTTPSATASLSRRAPSELASRVSVCREVAVAVASDREAAKPLRWTPWSSQWPSPSSECPVPVRASETRLFGAKAPSGPLASDRIYLRLSFSFGHSRRPMYCNQRSLQAFRDYGVKLLAKRVYGVSRAVRRFYT